MTTILQAFRRKWPEYLLEIIVIIIGVLGAFLLNNWNERRKQDNLETEVLTEIRSDIDQSIQSLENDVRINKNRIAVIEYIISEIEQGSRSDSLQLSFSLLLDNSVATIRMNGYDNLKNIGFHIITDDSLRSEITNLYENQYTFLKESEEKDNQITYQYFVPRYLDYFERIESMEEVALASKLSLKEVDHAQKKGFILLISYYKTRKARILFDLDLTIRQMEKVRDLLESWLAE